MSANTRKLPVWAYLTSPAHLLAVALLSGGVAVAGWWSVADRKPNGESPAEVNPVKRKTYTRDEVREIWNQSRYRNEKGLKEKLGPPDATTQQNSTVVFRSQTSIISNGGGGVIPVVTYHYYGLTVDSKGSGKVDRETVFKFIATHDNLQFIP